MFEAFLRFVPAIPAGAAFALPQDVDETILPDRESHYCDKAAQTGALNALVNNATTINVCNKRITIDNSGENVVFLRHS